MADAIGILGGTFAPIHNGHLRLAIEVREQLGLKEVRLIPAAQPPLRPAPAVPASRRLRWVQLALENEPGLSVDDCELRREGPSYTVETLAQLRARYPDAPLVLILGMDAAAQLQRWHRWESLLELAHLLFCNRPGGRQGFAPGLSRYLHGKQARDLSGLHARPAGFWWRCVIQALDISATGIRERLAAGHSVRGLVPDAVIHDLTDEDREALIRDEKNAAA
jgi:nicotinate-nucleotide adenylyltransferase